MISTSAMPRGVGPQALHRLAGKLKPHGQVSDQRLQPPYLFVAGIGLTALKVGLTAGQEGLTPPRQGSRGHTKLA